MKKNIEMLKRLKEKLTPIVNLVERAELMPDLEEKDDQLCVGGMIVCADDRTGSFEVIQNLDEKGNHVSIFSFPAEIYVLRYLISKIAE